MHVQLTLLTVPLPTPALVTVPARPPLIDENTRQIGRRGLQEARAALHRPTPPRHDSRPAAA